MSGIKAQINLQRVNKTYKDGDTISGSLDVTAKSDFNHEGVAVNLEGNVSLIKGNGDKETVPIVGCTVLIVKPGKIPKGKLLIPFSFPLEKETSELLDTYHGVAVNVEYNIHGEIRKGGLIPQTVVTPRLEIYVEAHVEPQKEVKGSSTKEFVLTPEKSGDVDWEIQGSVLNTRCHLDEPLKGHVVVEKSNRQIKSVELQLVRVEIVSGQTKKSSEVQNIQVATGDVSRALSIPLHMVFPRYFSCPSTVTNAFQLDFEVNVTVVFVGNEVVAANVPLVLCR